MGSGAITGYFDVAQIVLYGFWIFFAGLIVYLVRENKREGYPLESDRSERAPRVKVLGWPAPPKPKTYKLRNGSSVTVPNDKRSAQGLAAVPTAAFPGAPLQPTGNPMLDGVGPGAYADRADVPDATFEGLPRIVPLRAAGGFGVASQDPDPRGMVVVGADGLVGGRIADLWVDRSEMLFRYYEVEVAGAAHGAVARRVLLPVNFSRVAGGRVKVKSILSHQFGAVPPTRSPDQVTLLEEEKIMAYFGGGTLYADPARQEPFL